MTKEVKLVITEFLQSFKLMISHKVFLYELYYLFLKPRPDVYLFKNYYIIILNNYLIIKEASYQEA